MNPAPPFDITPFPSFPMEVGLRGWIALLAIAATLYLLLRIYNRSRAIRGDLDDPYRYVQKRLDAFTAERSPQPSRADLENVSFLVRRLVSHKTERHILNATAAEIRSQAAHEGDKHFKDLLELVAEIDELKYSPDPQQQGSAVLQKLAEALRENAILQRQEA